MDHLSLVELNKLIQKTLKDNLEPSYWVVAEIGELSVNQKGHCYLELIEHENSKVIAKARATIWSYTYRNLSTWFQGITGQPLSEGLNIMANVKISFHELYGFSLNVQDIDASYTIGEKERKRQEVINRLIQDGVFTMNKEHSLPLVPQSIAIISSPTAAGYGDFMQHLGENPSRYNIKTSLFEAIMQGNEAPQSIINALLRVNKSHDFDLVVLIRGGGSQLDLECFDDYDLCSHLAQFPLPVVTGIGHERDDTVADMVAHSKLKTPTAVAEFIIQGITAFEASINDLMIQIGKTASFIVQNAALKVQTTGNSIRLQAQSIIMHENHRLSTFTSQLRHYVNRQINQQHHLIEQLERQHQHLDPVSVLKRGFSFSTVDGKSVLGRITKPGQILITKSLKQIIESSITSVKKNGKI
jgi:exodeoxyribonuclease VII large subunit